MSRRALRRKKTLHHLLTGSDLLDRGGHLLMKATDPRSSPVPVKDERQWGASVFNDQAEQFGRRWKNIFTWTLSPIKRKKDFYVSHMKIKGIKTKSDHCRFHLQGNLLLY